VAESRERRIGAVVVPTLHREPTIAPPSSTTTPNASGLPSAAGARSASGGSGAPGVGPAWRAARRARIPRPRGVAVRMITTARRREFARLASGCGSHPRSRPSATIGPRAHDLVRRHLDVLDAQPFQRIGAMSLRCRSRKWTSRAARPRRARRPESRPARP
jgi:hypothetical protein